MAKDINVKITGDSRDLERALGSAQKATSGFGRALATAAKVGAVALGAGVAVGVVKSVKAASDLNESMNAINVVFGEATDTIREFGETSAESVGLSQRAFNQAVVPIGAALQNVGLSAQEAADQSVNLTQRAADMASVFNTDVSTALEAIQAALRGEADPIERFGIGLSDAAVQAQAARMGMKKLDGQFTAGQKVRARLALFFEQSNRFAGDFANTSGELANQQRILRSRLEDLAAKFGQVFLPILSTVVGKLLDFAGLLDRIASAPNIKVAVGIAFRGVRGAVTDLYETIRNQLFGFTSRKTFKLGLGRLEIERTWHEGLVAQLAAGLQSVDWQAVGTQVGRGISQAVEFTADMATRLVEFVEDNLDKFAEAGALIVAAIASKLLDPAFWAKHWKLFAVLGLSLIPFGVFAKIGTRIGLAIGRPIIRLLPEAFQKAIGVAIGVLSRFGAWLVGKVPGWLRAAFKVGIIVSFVAAAQNAVERLRRVVQRVVDWIRNKWGTLPGILRQVLGPLGSILGAINLIISAAQRAYDWLRKLSLSHANTGSFKGGPTDRSGNPRLGRAGASSAGGVSSVNLHLDGRQIASAVRLADGRWAMQNG